MYLLLDKEKKCLCKDGTFGSTDTDKRGGLVLLRNESWAYERSRRLLAAGIATSVVVLPSNIMVEADGSVYLTLRPVTEGKAYDSGHCFSL